MEGNRLAPGTVILGIDQFARLLIKTVLGQVGPAVSIRIIIRPVGRYGTVLIQPIEILPPVLKTIAKPLAKMVLNSAEEAGMSETNLGTTSG